MEKNRLTIMPKALLPDIRRHLQHLNRQIEKIDATLEGAVSAAPVWAKTRAILLSVPGWGQPPYIPAR